MQNTVELIITIAGSFVGVIVAIAGLFAGIGYYRQGKIDAKSSDIDSANSTVKMFKDRADLLDDELKQLRADFEAYKKEVLVKEESYKKTIDQQENLIKTYAGILQNRNPELENILKEIRDFLKHLQLKEQK